MAVGRGDRIELDFRGKHGVRYHQVVNDATLARIVRRCTDLPGSELFKYRDAQGRPHRVSSGQVNRYLHDITGLQVTAKDFRTWAATLLAVAAIVSLNEARPTPRGVAAVVKTVAGHLGNTPAVCRKSYIRPQLLADYAGGTLHPEVAALRERGTALSLAQVEAAVCCLLRQGRRPRPGRARAAE